MCTEMLIDGDEITRDECWCSLGEGYEGPARDDALRALGLQVYEALRREAEKAGPDRRTVSVTVTQARW